MTWWLWVLGGLAVAVGPVLVAVVAGGTAKPTPTIDGVAAERRGEWGGGR